MVIGSCLATSYEEAAYFILMLDALFVVMGLWRGELFRETEDEQPMTMEFISACFGLPAGLICRYFDTNSKRISFAMAAAGAASLSFAYSIFVDLAWMHKVSGEIDEGRVEVSWGYWPSQWVSVIILSIVAANHGILAKFCNERAKQEMRHQRVSREEREFSDVL
jgi:hypothetical protein